MSIRLVRWMPLTALVVLACAAFVVRAAAVSRELKVAVAANFKPTLEQLCTAFFAGRAGRCVVTSGASGLIYAKLAQGAPFDLFLSADRARAERLEQDGLAVRGTRFTYAIGQLVLWHPGGAAGTDLRTALADPRIRSLAIASPATAPYGAAAVETLRALGLATDGRYRVVQGESVAQTFQFVASGAADAGFVALAQVIEAPPALRGRIEREVTPVDASLHSAIEQQAVVLRAAADRETARALLEFMRTAEGRRIIEAAGYRVPPR